MVRELCICWIGYNLEFRLVRKQQRKPTFRRSEFYALSLSLNPVSKCGANQNKKRRKCV
jgi:hypothetical protein